jgi:CheY-like chemotaxis protein
VILLVENNGDDAALILGTLQQQVPANSIVHARDGAEAIDALKQWQREPLRLILLAANLPGVSGFDVLVHVRAARQTRHVPVVMLVNPDDSSDIARSYDLGANSLLSKADHGTRFTETVSQVVPYWLELNHPHIQAGSQH